MRAKIDFPFMPGEEPDTLFCLSQILTRLDRLELQNIRFDNQSIFITCRDAELCLFPQESFVCCEASGTNPHLPNACKYIAQVWVLVANKSCSVEELPEFSQDMA